MYINSVIIYISVEIVCLLSNSELKQKNYWGQVAATRALYTGESQLAVITMYCMG